MAPWQVGRPQDAVNLLRMATASSEVKFESMQQLPIDNSAQIATIGVNSGTHSPSLDFLTPCSAL
jgi:hypothetical protein